VVAFFSLAPFVISDSKASCASCQQLALHAFNLSLSVPGFIPGPSNVPDLSQLPSEEPQEESSQVKAEVVEDHPYLGEGEEGVEQA
jgi:hypothetical protein